MTTASLPERLRAFGADLTFFLAGALWSLIGWAWTDKENRRWPLHLTLLTNWRRCRSKTASQSLILACVLKTTSPPSSPPFGIRR